tara:strand:+ start:2418 stop:3044 length:627 start_codon:yes stop_codon:yes gene_type:complete
MASKSLTNTNISNTYVGVLHAKGAPLPATGSEYIYDGFGNRSGLRLGRDEIDISGTLGADFATAAAKALFPVGSVMFSADDVNPTQRFAGTTWEQVAEGRFIAGVGEGTDKNAATQTVAAGDDTTVGEYNHTLKEDELPSHSHEQNNRVERVDMLVDPLLASTVSSGRKSDIDSRSGTISTKTFSTGGGQSYNNLPPAFGLYVWKRTA